MHYLEIYDSDNILNIRLGIVRISTFYTVVNLYLSKASFVVPLPPKSLRC